MRSETGNRIGAAGICLAVAAALCGCASGSGTGAPAPGAHEEGNMAVQLDHEALERAVHAKGDAGLEALLGSEDAYYTEPVAFDQLHHTRVFRVVPNESSVPLDFLVGVDERSGEAALTSQHPNGLARVLLAEKELRGEDALPQLAYELLRPRAADVSFVDSADDLPPELQDSFEPPDQEDLPGGGLALRFQVLDEGRLMAWDVRLTAPGQGTLKVREIADGGAP